jgi:hypothetical protein
MRFRFALIGLCAACLVLADDTTSQKIQVGKTENFEFPANGTLRVETSTGELTIEGWDQPGVEISTTASGKDPDGAKISAKRNGDELVVTTEYPHHRAFPWVSPLSVVTNFTLDYRIRVPRNAKLIVRHDDGEVHIDNVAGSIQVAARQGLITLRMTGDTVPTIDARSRIGSVNSDFNGAETHHPWPFGHRLEEGKPAAGQNLHLRIGYGDIVILKAHNPEAPRPVT